MMLDIHVHSSYSNDGSASPDKILKHAKKIGLAGIAITDHNEISGSVKLWQDNRDIKDFIIIPGMEASSSEGHILALGIKEPIPRDLTPRETKESIEDLGGIAIASHPYRFWSGLGEDAVRKAGFPVIEVLNGRSLKKENAKARKLAEELGCGMTGGSDAHTLDQVGKTTTEVDTTSLKLDDVLEEIRKKRSRALGEHRKKTSTVGYAISCLYLWFKRGMKRI
jgi:predicted metal-dependent phosphoesterase TrpH